VSNASDRADGSEDDGSVDETEKNWVAKNLWMVKGLLVAISLAGFGVAVLLAFDGTLANVVWAMSVTLAALVVVVQLGIGFVQASRSA
jgi:hypothetical protein